MIRCAVLAVVALVTLCAVWVAAIVGLALHGAATMERMEDEQQ